MIVFNLLLHEWKKSLRAQGFYKNLAVNIMLGFFALYFAVILLFLGFSLSEILEKADSKLNPLELFNGAMLYIVLGFLTFRFLMQQLNTFQLPPYQVLPIKRATLVNFLLLRPIVSPINYFSLLVVVPFALKSVVGYYSLTVAFRFILIVILIIWFNSQMAAFLKRKYGSGWISFIVIFAILGSFAALEYFKIFSLFHFSNRLFMFAVMRPYGCIFPLLAAIGAYWLNRWFFAENFYPEHFNKHIKHDNTVVTNFSFLNRFGIIGEIITLEIKLILRHKRTKSILYMSVFFLFYGLIFYTKDVYMHNYGMLFFVAMFITGLFMLMFGQWVISWDSGHFDSLMTNNIPIRTYFNANYYLLIGFNVLCFVLSTPYYYFGLRIFYLHLAAFIFNSGVNVYLLLFLATYNNRRVDLSHSAAMNYQGTTYKSFLIILPIMLLPMLLVWVLSTLFSIATALYSLAALGLVGIALRNQLITICVDQFNRRKYILAEGFRQGE